MREIDIKAIKSANEMLQEVSYNGGMVDTDKIVEKVAKSKNYKVTVYNANFNLFEQEDFRKYGAFISIFSNPSNGKPGEAKIYLNKNNSAQKRRFSLMHEVGHLLVNAENYKVGKSYFGPQPDFGVLFYSDKAVNDEPALVEEQAANVFALSVLMPQQDFLEVLSKLPLNYVADFFGVTTDAVLARLELLREGNA